VLTRSEWLRLSGFGAAVLFLQVLGWGRARNFARPRAALSVARRCGKKQQVARREVKSSAASRMRGCGDRRVTRRLLSELGAQDPATEKP
jgi:hypothetical protein